MSNVLVIGASRGIGLGIVKQCLSAGKTVSATVRSNIPELEGARWISGIDTSDLDNLKTLASEFPDKSVDQIYYVAGIFPGNAAFPTSKETLSGDTTLWSDIEHGFQVNTLAVLKTFSVMEPCLKDGGKFAVLSTRMGSIADNTSGGRFAYRMSKTALNMAVASLVQEPRVSERGIIIPLLHPGYIQTDMTGGKGNNTVEECVGKMQPLVDGLTAKDSGKFFHVLTGEIVPW